MLQDLVVSKVRVKILQVFLYRPDELFYVRQLVRAVNEEINAVRRELKRMENAGMVKKEWRGNRLYYWFNKDYSLFNDLLAIISKTVSLGGKIIKNKGKLGKIRFAVLSGRFARRLPTPEGGVDLLVVGNVFLPDLTSIVKSEESELKREINYSVMSSQEFDYRKKRRDPFLLGILAGSRIMLIGDEEDLVS